MIDVCEIYGIEEATLDNGQKVSEILTQWHKLMLVAEVLSPVLKKNCDRGIFNPLTDVATIKVKLMCLIGEI